MCACVCVSTYNSIEVKDKMHLPFLIGAAPKSPVSTYKNPN